jgi:hypothetical protein
MENPDVTDPTTSHSAESFNVQRGMFAAHSHYGPDGLAYYGAAGELRDDMIQEAYVNEARALIVDLGICLANLPREWANALRHEADQVTKVAADTGQVPRVALDAASGAAVVAEPNGDEPEAYGPRGEHHGQADAAAALAEHHDGRELAEVMGVEPDPEP